MEKEQKKKILKASGAIAGFVVLAVFSILLTQYAKNTSRSIEVASLVNYIKSDLTMHYYYFNRYPDELGEKGSKEGKTMALPGNFSNYAYSMFLYSSCNEDLSVCEAGLDNPQNFKLEFNLDRKPFKGVERVVVSR